MDIKIFNRPFLSLILGLALILVSVPAHAATQYVSDQLIITMRSGAGNQYKVIKTLKTSTPVEVIEETEEHYKVRTEDGTEGWVRKQYITPETPKPVVISRLRVQIQRLESSVERLRGARDAVKEDLASEKALHADEVRELKAELKKKDGRISALTKELQETADKYDRLAEDSANVVEVVEERDRLKEENTRLKAEKEDLLKENSRLFRRNVIYWFLAGGGVFFVGWLIGQISRKRKKTFSDW